VYERKVTMEQLHAAIATLPDKQAKRLTAYYFLGMSKTEIARAENVNKSQITRSINRALATLEKYLKNLR
jgi:RNA polymerase sigma-70 factor (ECF subfamily)